MEKTRDMWQKPERKGGYDVRPCRHQSVDMSIIESRLDWSALAEHVLLIL